ncbi:MAG: YceD family protein [Candidatus Kapaibacteriales bacterium]
MLKILIKGIKDGEYDINISSPVEEIEGIFPEFFGNVNFMGKLRIIGKRFTVVGKAICNAHLVCDISMEDYTEQIEVEIKSSFLANNELYYSMAGISEELRETEEHIIHEDDKYIDLTDDVRQELALGLPMKRIAPKYRDKSFDDIYPQYSANKFIETKQNKKRKREDIDERWSALKKLKFN